MLILSGEPLRVRLPDREVRLTSGQIAEFRDDEALRLVKRSGGKVRALLPGVWIRWQSPLFSSPYGRVTTILGDGWLEVSDHSITGGEAMVAIHAVTEIFADRPDTYDAKRS